jgi:hypothetical protein
MPNWKGFLVMLLLVTLLAFTACSAIILGSGDLVTETRTVSDFDRIALEGQGEVIVTQSGSETLIIETYENIIPHVKVEVEGGTLTLGIEEDINLLFPQRLIFSVGVDDLSSLAIAGSGNIESDMLETEGLEVTVGGSGRVRITSLATGDLNVRINGSGEIELVGEASAQEISIGGSGRYTAGDVCSASVEVSISGSGDATVCATETLESNISGSGTVNYYGRPSISSSSSGSGTLNNLGEQ